MSQQDSELNSILAEAVEIVDAGQRDAYLRKACGDNAVQHAALQRMVKDYFSIGSLLDPPAVVMQTADFNSSSEVGQKIGPYKLLELIGEGGMGLVYMAEQSKPVRRRVALKLVKPGMDSKQVLARFEAERQAVAIMEHPNIARVLDAGTTDQGRPYFVMELVRGIPITEFCDQAQLTTRERLVLFKDICAAVQHAHMRGIIHRDLKPTNVLVTMNDDQPLVKVIDFGIAKAINQQLTDKTLFTAFQQMIGTPLYMSPEQAQMNNIDVDTRSDVYSLGVMLYEILTGEPPFDREQFQRSGIEGFRKILLETDPPRPSQRVSTLKWERLSTVSKQRKVDMRRFIHTLKGELDWIVMKAIEKDRRRRYSSASDFAADIERYLQDEAVQACPPSAAYRLSKFIRRYRTSLVTAAAFLFVMIAATAFSIRFALVADKQRSIATNLTIEANRQKEEIVKQKDEVSLQKKEAETQAQIAEERRIDAETMERTANQKSEELRDSLFITDMRLVSADIDAENISRARQKLAKYESTNGQFDRRSWEWYYLMGQTHDEVKTICVDFGFFTMVQWSPDGRYLAFSRRNNVSDIIILEAATFKQVNTLGRLSASAFAWSPDSTRIAYAFDGGGTVKIWDRNVKSELVLKEHNKEHDSWVNGLGWTPDGKSIATASEDGSRRVWDAISGKCRWIQFEIGNRLTDVCCHPNGKQIASGGKWLKKGLKIWDTETGHLDLHALPSSDIESIRYLPDGTSLLIGTLQGDLIRIDSSDGKQQFRVRAHADAVNKISVHADFPFAATAGADGLIRIWNTENGLLIRTLKGHADSVTAVDFRPGHAQLASSSNDGQLKLWNLDGIQAGKIDLPSRSNQVIEVENSFKGIAWQDDTHLNFNADVDLIRSIDLETRQTVDATRDPAIPGPPALPIWNMPEGRIVEYFESIDGGNEILRPTSFTSTNGLNFGWFDGNKRFWSRTPKCPVLENKEYLFTEDGTDMRTYDFVVFDVSTRKKLNTFTTRVGANCMAISNSCRQMAVYGCGKPGESFQGWLHIIDLSESSERSQKITTSVAEATSVAWSRDGKRIACGNDDGNLIVWNVDAGKVDLEERIHQSSTSALAWSPDNKRIAFGSASGLIKIIDSQLGVELLTLKGIESLICQIEWSPNGRRIAAQSAHGKIIVWDATHGYEYVEGNDYRRERVRENLVKASKLYDDGAHSDALPLIDQFLAFENDHLEGFLLRSRVHVQLKQHELALADFKVAITLSSKGDEDRLGVEAMKLGFAKEAIELLTTAMEASPETAARARTLRATAYLLDGQIDTGIRELEYIVHEKHEDFALPSLALAYLLTNDVNDYRSICNEQLLNLKIESLDNVKRLTTWMCSLSPNAIANYAPAIQFARSLVDKDSHRKFNLLQLGAILMRAGKYEEAKLTLEKELSLPSNPEISAAYGYFFLAMTEMHLGNRDSALKQFQEAEKLLREELNQLPTWNRKQALQLLSKETAEVLKVVNE